MMCAVVKKRYPHSILIFLFANTGQEAEETLRFTAQVDQYFNLGLAWLEAVIHPEFRKGTTHKFVDFFTACRDDSIWDAMCSKFGLPNSEWLHCTRELKQRPMYSYLRSIGWKPGTYMVAIGLRADEPKRTQGPKPPWIFYPLKDEGIEKPDVLEFWSKQPFDLLLPEHHGNCTWCWKKSNAKHCLNIKENRRWYEVPARLERYAMVNQRPGHGPRKMFRGGRTTADLLALADSLAPDVRMLPRPEEDQGCSESCEITFEDLF